MTNTTHAVNQRIIEARNGFTPPAAPEAELASIWGRALASDADREHWLSVRSSRVTGTDAYTAMRSRESTKRKAAHDKVSGAGAAFRGNRATEWGNYREDVMIDRLDGAGEYRCGLLIAHPDNDRITATPDIAGVDFYGLTFIREVKTKENHDLAPGSAEFKKSKYYEQIIGQLSVTRADRVILTVEEHNGDWSRWEQRPGPGYVFDDGTELADYGPEVVATHEYVFKYEDHLEDIKLFEERAADLLVMIDEARAGWIADGPEQFSEVQRRVYGAEARKYAEAALSEKKAKAAKEQARKEIIALAVGWDAPELAEVDRNGDHPELVSRKSFSEVFDRVKVTFTPASDGGAPAGSVPDEDAAREAQPELWERLQGARAALTAAQDQWDAELKNHQKKTVTSASVAKVTITDQDKERK